MTHSDTYNSCIAGYYILGVSEPPGVWIVLGGCTILTATMIVTISQFRREAEHREGMSKRSSSLTALESPALALDINKGFGIQ